MPKLILLGRYYILVSSKLFVPFILLPLLRLLSLFHIFAVIHVFIKSHSANSCTTDGSQDIGASNLTKSNSQTECNRACTQL